MTTYYNFGGATPECPGLTYRHIKFSEGTLLFAGANMLGALDADVYQLMDDEYSVVPIPKISISHEYSTHVNTSGDSGSACSHCSMTCREYSRLLSLMHSR